MAHERPLHSSVKLSRLVFRPLAIVAAFAAYGLITAGALTPTIATAAISGVALLVIAGALFAYVVAHTGGLDQARLAGRAQLVRRRYLRLVVAALVLLYLALVIGALNTSTGAIWQCLDWPACTTNGELVQLSLLHRGLAALATLLITVVAILTWRTYTEGVIRRAAGLAIGLMAAQNVVGLVQVVLAREGTSLPLDSVRAFHLTAGAAAWGALVVLGTLALRLPFPVSERLRAAPVAGERARSGSRWSKVVKDYVSLTKPGVISLLILTTITSMFITPAGVPGFWLVFWTAVGGWLMASGAHSVNCYMDRDIDINMGRTARRPIPSGRIPAWHALVLGLVLGAVAFATLVVFVNWAAAWLSLAGYLYYVFIYTAWLKRNSPSNIVIGGGAGAFPPLVGWAAVTGGVSLPALFLWLIIFYWTPPHFWALALIREKDYARAGVPMLPVVAGEQTTRRQIVLYTVQMLVLTLIPVTFGMFGAPYLLMAGALGGVFLHYTLRLSREGTAASAWGLYKFSLLYLALLFVAMVVDRVWLSQVGFWI
jgi:protoheme IX farnesyltransferase